jgi:hypothetical protein
MNKTIFIAAVIAIATVLVAGLVVLPGSVQEAQANPCSVNSVAEANGGDGDTAAAGGDIATTDSPQECTFIGNIDID